MYFCRQQENSMEDNFNKNDEIDLRTIYRTVKRFFSGIGSSIANIFSIALKRQGLVLFFLFLGIGVGIGLFFVMPPIFISTLTLSSGALRNDFCADLIDDIELIIEDK